MDRIQCYEDDDGDNQVIDINDYDEDDDLVFDDEGNEEN